MTANSQKYVGWFVWTNKRGKRCVKAIKIKGPATWDPTFYSADPGFDAVDKIGKAKYSADGECREFYAVRS